MNLSEKAIERLRFMARGVKLPITKGCCRLCRRRLPNHRRGYCTDECQSAYLMATSSQYVRLRVFEIDEGVCRGCGLDCDATEKRLWGYSTMQKMAPKSSPIQRGMLAPMELRVALVTSLRSFGFVLSPSKVETLWQADHIVPVVDGGSFLIENLQTLCQVCHKGKTTTESAMRAKREKLLGKKWKATQAAQGRTRRKLKS